MSNRDSDARYEHVQQGVPFFGSELLKHQVHTSLPGVVVSYDATTRRARVQPAVDHLVSPEGNPNAEFGDLEPMPNPIILDVPVIFPAGGGYTVHFPLLPDDPVLLLFSERDIAAFKQTLRSGPPASDDVMEIQHAVCIPGFVFPNEGDVMIPPPDIPPGTFPDWLYGVTIQTNDGLTYVHLAAEPREIHARIVGDPIDETTFVRMTPQRIYATPDNSNTSVEVQHESITGRINGFPVNPTSVQITHGQIYATPDNGGTFLDLVPGTVTIMGNLAVIGGITVRDDIAVAGEVDGVDVSVHDHTGGTDSDGTTGPPR